MVDFTALSFNNASVSVFEYASIPVIIILFALDDKVNPVPGTIF